MNSRGLVPGDRSRIAWWIVTLAVGLVFLFVLSVVVESIVLGLFIYYTMRPLYTRLQRVIPSPGIAAAVTLLGIALPILGLIVYVGARAFREALRARADWLAVFKTIFGSALVSTVRSALLAFTDPGQPLQFRPSTLNRAFARGSDLLAPIGDAVVTLFLSVALAFFLLRDGDRLVAWMRSVLDDPEGSTLHTFVVTVDHDLESIYLGHVATAVLVGIGSAIVYNGFNALVSPTVTIPFPTLLGLLTGVASLIPIVVGKLVYVPLSLYLAVVAIRSNASVLPALGLFVVSFVVLDILPLFFLRPYLAGRQLHVGLVMFSYVVGTLAFGWPGLFLGPLLVVIGLHLLGIVMPELIHGEPITAADVGTDPFAADPGSGSQADEPSEEVPD